MTRKEIQQRYRNKYRVEIRRKAREYYRRNAKKLRMIGRRRYADPSNKIRQKSAINETNRLNQWIGLIPIETRCMICEKHIFLRTKNKGSSIHFDHRHGGNEPIKGKPNNFLRSHKRSKENEKMLVDSDFGHLCCKCNLYLSTKNRKRLVMSMIKYVFGPDILEQFHDLFSEYKRSKKK